VDIPGGTFQMGAADLPDATPIHQVTVPSFRIARTEVSTCQYRACADAGACMFPAGGSFDGPVLGVDLAAACAFCSFAGGRLCSEAEWEYAARNGAKGTLYPWGDQTPTCQHGVFSDAALGCASPSSLPGCSRPAGNDDWGVCDLAGNAWEWVQDCYLGTYDGAPADGSPREVCPGSDLHAKRGASFVPYQMPDALRSSRRWAVFPGNLPVGGGVRCCAAPNP
jgi:formylglycine-generating enzyme required for sulfatase activity